MPTSRRLSSYPVTRRSPDTDRTLIVIDNARPRYDNRANQSPAIRSNPYLEQFRNSRIDR